MAILEWRVPNTIILSETPRCFHKNGFEFHLGELRQGAFCRNETGFRP
jgi:hypothetical protein